MKKALITGVCGQDGAYLAASLISEGYHVTGLTRRSSQDYTWRLKYLDVVEKLDLRTIDLTEQYAVIELIMSEQFDEVYNLAAQSFVGASWDSPVSTTMVNSLGVLYLLDAIKRFSPHTKMYQASTSEMYGLIQEPVQNEDTKLYPRSPYGVSKVFAHQMLINYRESFNLHLCSGILFNHESPLRGLEFVTRKITHTLAAIKLGSDDVLSLGNLDAKRDWGFAAEYVEGMKMMLRHPKSSDFVLATGVTQSVRDFVNYSAEALEIELEWTGSDLNECAYDVRSGRQIVRVDERFYRPAEVDILLGSSEKAKVVLGWQPKVKAKDLAAIMIKADYDRLK